MSAKTCMRLGTASDLRRTNQILLRHKQMKESVLETLKELSEEAGGIVIEQIKQEMGSVGMKIAGRGVVIFSGIASIILLSTNVGAALGIGGVVVGYMMIGGSILYEMKCKKDKAKNLQNIQARLQTELEKYTASQKRVFRELDMYDIFTTGVDFKDNLNRIKMIVENAERVSEDTFDNIEELIVKLKKCFNTLPKNKQNSLMSEDFLMTMKTLLGDVDSPFTLGGIADTATGVASAAIDVASTASWWEAIHGLNILLNLALVAVDIKKFMELNRMREKWNAGGDVKNDLLKDPKFQLEISLRDVIFQIRDNIMKHGY